ncbi:MAG: aminotransferase class I/II-fold pyridoxal phosphate-dependent enzyme, partial [Woeseiaceae bacterium]|nr:aminotransferase class I/II-fold pyridoxal phosphate-dependent enzyme [Woeseiaceae bacterium]
SMYEHYATLQGVEARRVPLNADDDFRFDAKRVLAACDDSSKLVIICSPNNPTGLSAGVDEIRAVADARRERSVVVVDEAYIEFAGTPSAYELLDEFDNLIVLRTLSKAQGLAGARCGGLIARCELLDRFDAVQAPYSMPTPVVECVLRELDDASTSRYSGNIRALIDERDRLAAALADLACVVRVFPSDANFLLVRFTDAPAIACACRAAGILVREPGAELEGCIRITVGTPEENDHLLGVLTARREACA